MRFFNFTNNSWSEHSLVGCADNDGNTLLLGVPEGPTFIARGRVRRNAIFNHSKKVVGQDTYRLAVSAHWAYCLAAMTAMEFYWGAQKYPLLQYSVHERGREFQLCEIFGKNTYELAMMICWLVHLAVRRGLQLWWDSQKVQLFHEQLLLVELRCKSEPYSTETLVLGHSQ